MSTTVTPEWEVLAIRYGTRVAQKSIMYLNFQVYGESDEPIELSYYVWILRQRDRVIVIDTGYSPEAGRARGRLSALTVEEVFELAEIDPASVAQVVITHAHDDHMGNLALFSSADFVMAQAEFDFWTGPYASRSQFAGSVEPSDIAALRDAKAADRVRTFVDHLELVPGVDIMRVGGHTPGQVIIKVNTSDGGVLLCSDAVHFYDELELDRPFAFVADLLAMYDGFDKVRNLRDSGEVNHVIPGHDSSLMTQYPAATGRLKDVAVVIGAATSSTDRG